MKKYYKGEKYIYLLMATRLCLSAGIEESGEFSKTVLIGDDNGIVGGQNYFRKFRLQKHDGKWILNEYKSSRGFAEFSRSFQVGYTIEEVINKTPAISDYMNEYGDNCGQNWVH